MKLFSILLLTTVFIFNGCGDSTDKSKTTGKDQKMVDPESRKMNPLTYKGMYTTSEKGAEFFDCSTDITYLMSETGETQSIKEVYDKMPSKKPDEKVYVEIEGFVSVQTSSTSKDMDTVMVVTRFFKLDRAGSCN